MTQFSVLSKQCPLCGAPAVERLDTNLSFKPPTHRCRKCGAELKTVFTRAALWCIPVSAVTFTAMWFALIWLQQSLFTGIVRAALMGGTVALAASIPFNVVLRGVIFQPCKK